MSSQTPPNEPPEAPQNPTYAPPQGKSVPDSTLDSLPASPQPERQEISSNGSTKPPALTVAALDSSNPAIARWLAVPAAERNVQPARNQIATDALSGLLTVPEAAALIGTTKDVVFALRSKLAAKAAKAQRPHSQPATTNDTTKPPASPPTQEAEAQPIQPTSEQPALANQPAPPFASSHDNQPQPIQLEPPTAEEAEAIIANITDHPQEVETNGFLADADDTEPTEDATEPSADGTKPKYVRRKTLDYYDQRLEEEEISATRGLMLALGKKAKAAENGKDAQAFTASMLTVANLRRRAKGLPIEQPKPASEGSVRPTIFFVGQGEVGRSGTKAALARKRTPPTLELEAESGDLSPALQASLQNAPAYVADL